MLNLSKLYTIFAVSFPLLSLYGIGISTVTIADFVLLLLFPFLLLENNWKKLSWGLLLFLLYILFQYSFFAIVYETTLLKTLRYSCYVAFLALFSGTYFLFDYGVRVLKLLSVCATFFLCIQYLFFHFLGIYIPGYLTFLPIMRDDLVAFSNIVGLDGGDMRMRSFFAEPAHYAQYIVCCIALLLWKGKFCYNAFLFLGVFISGASTGLLSCCLLFVIAVIKKWRMKMKPLIWFLFFIAGMLIMYILSSMEFYNTAIMKLSDERAIMGRFGGLATLIAMRYTNVELWFGHGFNPLSEFLSGYLMLFYYLGIVGLSMYLFICLYKLFSVDAFDKKVLLLLFFFLNVGTEVVMGPFLVLYFSFIISKKK